MGYGVNVRSVKRNRTEKLNLIRVMGNFQRVPMFPFVMVDTNRITKEVVK